MINNKLKIQLIHLTVALMAFTLGCIKVDQWLSTKTVVELHAQEPAQPAPSPSVSTEATPEPVVEDVQEQEEQSEYDMEDLKRYLREIFGSDWKVAYSVAQVECNSNRPEWPRCSFSWEKEHSIGWFQINIAQEGGHGKKVHWDKIPGESLEEKEEWLKNPYNNILMAKIIHDRSGSFNPWTGYTSGNYLRVLEDME